MAKKAAITKVLSCFLVLVILMSVMHVSVFAVNESNNSTCNVSNRSNELENSFRENNSAEVMMPLFNNNTTGKYRAWTREDNNSGDCVEQNNAFYVPARAHTIEIRKNGCSGELPEIKDEEYLAHDGRFPFYLTKSKDQIVQEAGIEKSNYTFSFYGNVKLLWNYVNDERYADVDFEISDDINEDGIYDILISDCKLENKLLVISGNDDFSIWSKNYPVNIRIGQLDDDVNGDGIDEAIVYCVDYDWTSNKTNIAIELLSGSDGEKIWGKKISYEGSYYCANVHGTHGDLTGDGIADILIDAVSWERSESVLHALNSKDGLKLSERTFDGVVFGYCYAQSVLTNDGIYDFAVGSNNQEDNTAKLFVIRGSDGYAEWHKSFVGDVGWVYPFIWD